MRFLFHIGDAPPHGRIYSDSRFGDYWPEGCPCGITIENLAIQMKELNIRYKLLKIGSAMNLMAEVFKTHIADFEVQELDS